MRASVRLRVDDDHDVVLGHGDLIGRSSGAALCLDDARVSEAHAMVSLRGGNLMLLALRRRLVVDGRPVSEVELAAGLEVGLAPGLTLQVEELRLPSAVLGIRLADLSPQTLVGVTSIYGGAHPRLVVGVRDDAAAFVWSTDDRWRLQRRGEDPLPVGPGSEAEVDGARLRFELIELAGAGVDRTRAGHGPADPLTIVARCETAHVHRAGVAEVVNLVGVQGRILSELVTFGGPTPWLTIAREIWRDDDDTVALRRKWDVNLSRLRRKLRDAGVRSDLIHSDGSGHFQLLLYEGDAVRDEA
jgi:hypothetical protein